MIKTRLKELDIKITELADYLQISRPTLYKYMESYDRGEKDEVNKKVLRLFDYIEENPLLGKKNVITYILTSLATLKELDASPGHESLQAIRHYVSLHPDDEKTLFMKDASSEDTWDEVIHYLMLIRPLLKKKNRTEEEERELEPYQEILSRLKEKGEN